MPLTDKACKNAKSSAKIYKMSDSRGLYLEVTPAGGRYWRWKYRFMGKEKRLAFGVYPDVSLAVRKPVLSCDGVILSRSDGLWQIIEEIKGKPCLPLDFPEVGELKVTIDEVEALCVFHL